MASGALAHRGEIGPQVVIFFIISQELASWPFCTKFWRKARPGVRDRHDPYVQSCLRPPQPPRGPGPDLALQGWSDRPSGRETSLLVECPLG